MMHERTVEKALLASQTAVESAGRVEIQTFIGLYDEFFARVYNYVRYRCGDATIADDLTAQTFERALTYLRDFDPQRGSFGSWLFTIARNVINNYLRAEKRRDVLLIDCCPEQVDRNSDLEDSLVRMETESEILAAVFQLGERERDLISLKFAAGFTNRRIAEVTGMTENHVAVVLFRAIRRLRQILDQNYENHVSTEPDR